MKLFKTIPAVVAALLFALPAQAQKALDYGPYTLTGQAAQRDTLIIEQLYNAGFQASSKSPVGMLVTCTYSVNPQLIGQSARILKWTASSFHAIVDTTTEAGTQDAVNGFSANFADGDMVIISFHPYKYTRDPVVVQTTATAWQATKGPVTGTGSQIFGVGVFRIEALGAVVVGANSGTATNMGFAMCTPAAGTGLLLSTVGNAIASDGAGTTYLCALTDTAAIAPTEVATTVAFTRHRDHLYDNSGIAPLKYYTAAGAWVISDTTSATNTGTRFLWARLTPISGGFIWSN